MTNPTYKSSSLYLFPLILFWLLSCPSAWGKDLVSGRFESASGSQIVVSINIHPPPPAALIVELDFPPGNKVIATSPKARKINLKNGNVKWLFKNVRSKKITLTTTLQSPLKGKARATVRYHAPKNSQMKEIRFDS